MTFRFLRYGSLAAVGFIAAGLVPPSADARATRERAVCTVSIDTVSVAVIGGGSGGGGVLKCGGKSYPFSIGGGGLGSIGVARIRASGSVYRLANIRDFEGAYGQLRAGATAGRKGTDAMMLQNEHGVVMRLKARSSGLAVTAGGDALVVRFK